MIIGKRKLGTGDWGLEIIAVLEWKQYILTSLLKGERL
jgi:hypothetical protein